MKCIKPLKLGLLHRTFERARRHTFVATPFLFVKFDGRLVPEMEAWPILAEELSGGAFDEGLPKERGEVLAQARAYAPSAEPTKVIRASLTCGPVEKAIAAIGARVWNDGAPTAPLPITELPISYSHAFGGEGFASNPIGRGAQAKEGAALPSVEDPNRLIRSMRDRPDPAGFGPLDVMWEPRRSRLGTYDEKWLKTRFPGFPDDMDPTALNGAPRDQQIDGYWRGDEAYRLINLHPEKPEIEGALPGLRTRCFINRKGDGGERFEEIPTRLETVWFFPHRELAVLVFRGTAIVAEDDASDVLQLVAACERVGEERAAEHYRELLTQRLDKKKGAILALRDGDLMPIGTKTMLDLGVPSIKPEGVLGQNMRRRAALELERVREDLRSRGLDPDAYVPKELPPEEKEPSLDELPNVVEEAMERAEKERVAAEEKKEHALAEARAACEAQGLDFDALMKKSQAEAGGPPKLTAKSQLAELEELVTLGRNAGAPLIELEERIRSRAFIELLEKQERRLRDAYRRFAHYFPAAPPRGEDGSLLRAGTEYGAREKLSFAEHDLTGVDLSGLDLSGADFGNALMEGVNLTKSSLRGANLRGAVLARATLEAADLSDSDLTDANLGEARISNATFDGADLTGATLARASIEKTSFRRAKLRRTEFLEARLSEAVFDECEASQVQFIQLDMCGTSFARATLEKCNFIETKLTKASFAGAKMTSSVFVTVDGDGGDYSNATLTNLRVVHKSTMSNATFERASLARANFRGVPLRGSNLTRADLTGADFSEADLGDARIDDVTAVGARFVKARLFGATMKRANLMGAMMAKADVRCCDLRGSNLFRSDVSRIAVDMDTKLDGAHLVEARIHPKEGA